MGRHRSTKLFSRTSLFLLIGCGFAFGAPGDVPESTYRTSVSEVQLTFSATDQNNHGVATLQASDVAIVDKELIVRNLRSFSRADFTRLELVMLVDTSASIRNRLPKETANVAAFLKQTAGVPEESLSVVSFQRQTPTVVCAGNCRASHANPHLPAQSEGLTPLYDSMVFAADLLGQRADTHARKVLVLLSDGEDTVSRSTAADALAAAIAQQVQIYAVNIGGAGSGGASVLRGFANATGGRYYTIQNADKVLDAVFDDFHASYTVTYRLPSRAPGYHDIRILPTRNVNLIFRGPGGYYFPKSAR